MKVISLINMKGGVGKTTLSVNICDCLARRDSKKVLLIDLDPQFNATQCLMTGEQYINHISSDMDNIVTVFDRNRSAASTVGGINQLNAKPLAEITPIKVKDNFFLLPGNLELYRIEMATGDGRENRIKNYLNQDHIKNNFDIIIIDTPPTPSIWMTSALIASDYYLIPVKPDPISFTGIDLLKGIVAYKRENYSLSIECLGIILTMTEDNLVYKQALKFIEDSSYWKTLKFKGEILKRTSVAREQMQGTFILDLGDEKNNINLARITNELLTRISR